MANFDFSADILDPDSSNEMMVFIRRHPRLLNTLFAALLVESGGIYNQIPSQNRRLLNSKTWGMRETMLLSS